MSGIAIGHGEIGGTGLLLDSSGNDTYRCEEPVEYACQGGSLFGGVGMVLDEGGDDSYIIENGTDHFAYQDWPLGQGGGGTGGVGVMYDASGDDMYKSHERSTGYSTCGGLGILLDNAGADTYASTNGSAIGFGSIGSCGLFHKSSEDPTVVGPGLGLLWDQSGIDTYQTPDPPSFCGERKDGKTWLEFDYDLEAVIGAGVDLDSELELCV